MLTTSCVLAWCLVVNLAIPHGVVIPMELATGESETRILYYAFQKSADGERRCRKREDMYVTLKARGTATFVPDVNILAIIKSTMCKEVD